MNLVIDIGNTCTKLACFSENELVEVVKADHEIGEVLRLFCRKYSFQKGIISSVSDIETDFKAALSELKFPVLVFESGKTAIPIKNRYSTPHTLGSDRLAAAVGVFSISPRQNALIVDIGTCVTFDFLSAKGEYWGGNISPGPTMRLKALHAFTHRLPLVERKGETPILGVSTETAIRSGVMRGLEYEIEGYVSHLSRQYPELLVYLTGGIHLNLHFSEKIRTFADDFVVPKGLNVILNYNNELL